MISRKTFATQLQSGPDPDAECRHQRPMPLQNSGNLASYELHPQKLVRLTGCRDLNAANRNLRTVALEQTARQHQGMTIPRWSIASGFLALLTNAARPR
jgi:hypothetical protein